MWVRRLANILIVLVLRRIPQKSPHWGFICALKEPSRLPHAVFETFLSRPVSQHQETYLAT